jgi:hypothetical protein
MDNYEDVPRGQNGLAGFARRVGELLTKGLTFSGKAQLARWAPLTELHQPRTMARLNGVDRSDLRLMNSERQITPADLEVAIRRAGSGQAER